MTTPLTVTVPSITETVEWGVSVGDARRFIERADECWLAVRIGLEDHSYAKMPKAAVKASLLSRYAHEPMPCELNVESRELWIGTPTACRRAKASGAAS